MMSWMSDQPSWLEQRYFVVPTPRPLQETASGPTQDWMQASSWKQRIIYLM